MTYDYGFLKDRGFFRRSVQQDDTLTDGTCVEYVFDPENRLALFSLDSRTESRKVVTELRQKRNFDLYWFWASGKLVVFAARGERRSFIFDSNAQYHTETKKSKLMKIASLQPGNTSGLFDTEDVVNRFYSELWDLRRNLAETITNNLDYRDRVLCSQRIIDRIMFLYFLIEKRLVYPVDKDGKPRRTDSRALFRFLVESTRDFYVILCRMFEHLNNPMDRLVELDDFSLYLPYLNGGLFRDRVLRTRGSTVKETELRFKYDWIDLIGQLNRYNWIIDEYLSDEPTDTLGNLTPEVLGHIYEKFVITVSEMTDDEIAELMSKKSTSLAGNKRIGAYYTPGTITHHIVERTLDGWLESHLGCNLADLDPNAQTKKNMVKLLSEVKVLDPAVGSGAFLMAAAEHLVSLWRICGRNDSEYALRREIILNNLFGVDIMEGATDICMLRLWLWLVSSLEEKKDADKLPEIDFNIRRGNSLVGLVSRELLVNDTVLLVTDTIDSEMQKYRRTIDEFKARGLDRQRNQLLVLHSSMQDYLTTMYAQCLNVTVTQPVHSDTLLLESIKSCKQGDAILTLKFKGGPHSAFKQLLKQSGFRVTANQAALKFNIRKPPMKTLDIAFRGIRKADNVECHLERPVSSSDLEGLFPFHWVMEFPHTVGAGKLFDVIVGNPPYGLLRKIVTDTDTKGLLGRIYDAFYVFQSGNRNLYKLFLERCTHLLAPGGCFGMIFPTAFLGEQSSLDLRVHLFSTRTVKEILQFPERTKVFIGVTQDVCIFIYGNQKPSDDRGCSLVLKTQVTNEELQDLFRCEFPQVSLLDLARLTGGSYSIPTLEFPEIEWEILSYLSQIPPLSGNPENPPMASAGEGHLHETADRDYMSTKRTPDLLVKGIHLSRYFVDLNPDGPQPRWLRMKSGFFESKPMAKIVAQQQKIVGKSTINKQAPRRMQFSILKPNIVVTNNVKFLLPSKGVLPGYLLAVLNSGLAEWRVSKYATTNRLTNYEVENLPVPRLKKADQKLFDYLATLLLSIKDSSTKNPRMLTMFQSIDRILDACVYEAYFDLQAGVAKLLYQMLHENILSDSRRMSAVMVLQSIDRIRQSAQLEKKVKSVYEHRWVKCITDVLRNRSERLQAPGLPSADDDDQPE